MLAKVEMQAIASFIYHADHRITGARNIFDQTLLINGRTILIFGLGCQGNHECKMWGVVLMFVFECELCLLRIEALHFC